MERISSGANVWCARMQGGEGEPSVVSLKEELTAARERIAELEAVLQSSSPGDPSDKEARKVMPCPSNLCPYTLLFCHWRKLCQHSCEKD